MCVTYILGIEMCVIKTLANKIYEGPLDRPYWQSIPGTTENTVELKEIYIKKFYNILSVYIIRLIDRTFVWTNFVRFSLTQSLYIFFLSVGKCETRNATLMISNRRVGAVRYCGAF